MTDITEVARDVARAYWKDADRLTLNDPVLRPHDVILVATIGTYAEQYVDSGRANEVAKEIAGLAERVARMLAEGAPVPKAKAALDENQRQLYSADARLRRQKQRDKPRHAERLALHPSVKLAETLDDLVTILMQNFAGGDNAVDLAYTWETTSRKVGLCNTYRDPVEGIF